MSKRVGIVGGVAGVVAAGAAIVLAVDRAAAKRRRGQSASDALSQWPVDRSGRVVADDGVGLYYEEVGPLDAPLTAVFVHGYCLQMGEYVFQRRALVEEFGDRIRLVFFDQRSHGRSDRSEPENVSIEQLGRDLACVVDTLAPRGPLVLVGHSMGGMALMALAGERPELFAPGSTQGSNASGPQRVVAVALLSTSAGKLGAVAFGLPALLAKVTTNVLPFVLRSARRQGDLIERGRAMGTDVAWVITRRLSFGAADADPETVEYLTHMIAATRIEVVADFYPALVSHDALDALPMLDHVRLLVLCGDRDLLTPVAHSEQIAEAVPGAELVIVPDAGHVVLLERPEIVTTALSGLINSVLEAPSAKRKRR